MNALVELEGVTRTFDGPKPVYALRGIDLSVFEGDGIAIRGASGSGKSTLLNILGLLDRPTAGLYRLAGTDVSTLSDNERSALRGQQLGFVFQTFHLLSHRTVLENVMLADVYGTTDVKPWTPALRASQANEALRRVKLDERIANEKPTKLSGGERQRVAIARAILRRPPLLLCDEPTGNLDSENTAAVLRLFSELQEEGLTIMMITHDDQVASAMQRSVRIRDGQFEKDESLIGEKLGPIPVGSVPQVLTSDGLAAQKTHGEVGNG
jgi:putative ABC transport system ATP-binding protein